MKTSNNKYGLVVSCVIWLLFAAFLQAADPTGLINYQGRLLDKYGRRVNTPVEITFRIFNGKDELLWSEKHGSVPVTDGLYSTILGFLTPLPASLFESDEVYFEIAINGETLTPRQRVTAAPYALTARTVNGPDLYVAPDGKVGIGTKTPGEKLDVAGKVRINGIKLPTGASVGYVLTSDADGEGHWQPVTATATNELDPHWTSVSNTVMTGAARGQMAYSWGDHAIRGYVTGTVVRSESDPLWSAASSYVLMLAIHGDTAYSWGNHAAMGYVTGTPVYVESDPFWSAVAPYVMAWAAHGETAYQWGEGASANWSHYAAVSNVDLANKELTNVAAMTLGGERRTTWPGSTNSTIWNPGAQTIADNSTTIQVAQAFAKIGTDGSLRNFSGCALQIAPGAPGQLLIIQTTNSCVKLNDGKGVKLAGGVNFYMSTNDTIQLIYDGSTWIETQRTDNDDQYRP